MNHPYVALLLLSDAITRCVTVAGEIAASRIVVDTEGDGTTRLYEKIGLISLPKLPVRMFHSMQTAEMLRGLTDSVKKESRGRSVDEWKQPPEQSDIAHD